MNLKFKEVFKGKVVNQALTINTGVEEFPRYVLEYLIDNYCSEETFHADMEKVVRRLKENFVHGAEADKRGPCSLFPVTRMKIPDHAPSMYSKSAFYVNPSYLRQR